jgi:hypothetical protein
MLNTVGRLLSSPFYRNPILVIGTGRSGTSVLLQALGKHPKIYALPGEAPFLTSIGGAAYLFEHADNTQYYLDSIKIPKDYLYDRLRRLGYETAAGPYYGLREMIKGLVGKADSPMGRKYWCAKSFPGEESTRGLCALYPTIRFIYIVRNGCDVVHSMTRYQGFAQEDFRGHCLRWAEDVEKYRYLTKFPQCCSVTQESLLANPAEVFHKIFDHFGLPAHSGAAEFTATTLVHPLDKSTRTNVNPIQALAERKPPYVEWTPEQKRLFKEICGKAMAELGYEVPF